MTEQWPFTESVKKRRPAWARTEPKTNPEWDPPLIERPQVIARTECSMNAGITEQTYRVYIHGFETADEWLSVSDLAGRVAVTRDSIKRAILNLTKAGLLEPHETNPFYMPASRHTWRRKDEGELTAEQMDLFHRIVAVGPKYESRASAL